MKKILAIAMMLGLCSGAALYLSSCAKLGGPLSPDLKLLSATSTTGDSKMMSVTVTAPSSLSGTAKAQFDRAMDAATLSNSSIRVYTQDATGTSETLYSYSVSYNAASGMLTITPAGGVWTNDRVYHIMITTAVRTLTGSQLDGNGNGIAESDAFDAIHSTFSLGTPTAPGYMAHRRTIEANVSWTGGWVVGPDVPSYTGTLTFNDETGNIPANYCPITITVTFVPYLNGSPAAATADPGYSMDSSTFFSSASSLHPNVVLTNAAGSPVAVSNVEVLSSGSGYGVANDQLRFVLNATAGGTVYKLKLRGGTSGIRSSSDGALYLSRGHYFDGDSDNYAEASDDTKYAIFSTANVDNANMPRFYVSGSSGEGVGQGQLPRRIAVDFFIEPGVGTGTIDRSTVNSNTVMLYNADYSEPITPVSIETDNSTPGTPKVYIYIPTQFYDTTSGFSINVQVIVKGVKTAEGLAMDQDPTGAAAGDGVHGQDNDRYLSGNISVYNHAY